MWLKRLALVALVGMAMMVACARVVSRVGHEIESGISAEFNLPFDEFADVHGNGTIVSKSFKVSDFSKLIVDGTGSITILQGATPQLTVTTDENLLEYVSVRNEADKLRLKTRHNVDLNPTDTIHYEVTVVNLNGIQVDGAAEVEADGFNTGDLVLEINGAGSLSIVNIDADSVDVSIDGVGMVTLAGQTDTQTASIDGAGRLDLAELKSESAEISVSGLGSATVWATEQLSAELQGAGNIEYIGSPQLTKSVDGIGMVQAISGR